MSYHLIQKGPSFPRPLDMTIDPSGVATVRYTDDHGQQKTERERLKMPADLANGMMLTLLKNVRPGAVPAELPLIVATPKPRVITLKLAPPGEESFSTGATRRKALHYVVKVDIGGLAGFVAPIVGKQPPDSHVWILGGDVPAFVKSDSFSSWALRSGASSCQPGVAARTNRAAPQRRPYNLSTIVVNSLSTSRKEKGLSHGRSGSNGTSRALGPLGNIGGVRGCGRGGLQPREP